MLVLSRKNQEAVVVGGGGGSDPLLKITVLEVAGGRVTLGFEAIRDVPVYRLEIWERMCASGGPGNREARPETPQLQPE